MAYQQVVDCDILRVRVRRTAHKKITESAIDFFQGAPFHSDTIAVDRKDSEITVNRFENNPQWCQPVWVTALSVVTLARQ